MRIGEDIVGRFRGGKRLLLIFSEVDDMLVQASVDIRVLKEAGLFSTVSVVCNGVVNGGVQGAGVFSNGCCGTIFEYQHCSCPCCL